MQKTLFTEEKGINNSIFKCTFLGWIYGIFPPAVFRIRFVFYNFYIISCFLEYVKHYFKISIAFFSCGSFSGSGDEISVPSGSSTS